MELILWRHADAEDAGAGGDDARALTKKGRKQAQRMAEWLRPRLEGEWKVLSSPAVRARETVEALGRRYEVRRGLGTASHAEAVLREAGWPDGGHVIVVGHQPTLGEVASRLLGSDAAGVSFRKGAVWWFVTRDRGAGAETVLKAVVDPDLLEGG